MKTTLCLLMASLAICARAQSSGGSPGSHAANNGGFSQPPTLAPSTPANTPSAANPNAAPDINNVNPNVNGATPGNTARAYFVNVPSTQRQGIEVGGEYTAVYLRVYANYALVDATFQFNETLS